VKEIIGLMVNGQALGSEDIDPPSCFLRKAASTLSSIWARSGYSKRGAHSWHGDTSIIQGTHPSSAFLPWEPRTTSVGSIKSI